MSLFPLGFNGETAEWSKCSGSILESASSPTCRATAPKCMCFQLSSSSCAHTELAEMLCSGCDLPANSPGYLLLAKIRGGLPQECPPHTAVMKRQINHKYFMLSYVQLRSDPFCEKAISLTFIAVSSLEWYQMPVRCLGCHHAAPAHPAILQEFLSRSYLFLMGANSSSFTHLPTVTHEPGKNSVERTRWERQRSMSLVSVFWPAVISYTEKVWTLITVILE